MKAYMLNGFLRTSNSTSGFQDGHPNNRVPWLNILDGNFVMPKQRRNKKDVSKPAAIAVRAENIQTKEVLYFDACSDADKYFNYAIGTISGYRHKGDYEKVMDMRNGKLKDWILYFETEPNLV